MACSEATAEDAGRFVVGTWRDLGLLRLDCLLAKADGLIDRGGSGDRAEAGLLLERASAEVERHLADHAAWLVESRSRIGRRSAKLA